MEKSRGIGRRVMMNGSSIIIDNSSGLAKKLKLGNTVRNH
jgi:hypothetical protein